ncbi:hypothetical protein GLYMA_20G010500v4 [Glycine max]|nr:hypothetical protein GLYMA_20G010500v4 [Glycine max]KAH1033996.1 hypothetical protein GYH30_054417 [Glycine max]
MSKFFVKRRCWFTGPQESEVPRTSLKTQHLIELLCCLSSILCNFIRHPFVTKEFNKLVKFFKYIRFPAILPVPQTLHRRIVYVEEITLLSKGMTFSHWKKQPKVFREKNVLTHSLCQVYSPITEMNASKISRSFEIKVRFKDDPSL